MAITRINNNVSAQSANRNLNETSDRLSKSIERLSSGLRINRAADDAAGLTISENLRSQINGINQAVDNASSAINVVNTAEGALNETTNLLQRIRTLAVQAANTGTNDSTALKAIQDEISTSISEITRIGTDTQFGTRKLINGDNANTASMMATNTGISLSSSPTATDLSDGTRYLTITQTSAGSETLANGVDGANNSGATAFTGSTFDSGTYDVVVSNVVAAAARKVNLGEDVITNGTNTITGTEAIAGMTSGTVTLAATDELVFSFTLADGSSASYTAALTSSTTADAIATAATTALAGDGTVTWDDAAGTFSITAAATGSNDLAMSLGVDVGGAGAPYEASFSNVVAVAGNDNTATITVGGGASQQVTAGGTYTFTGPEPSDPGESTPEITMTLGATLTNGTDSLAVVAQSYTGSLEGGATVTFQNGDEKVSFLSGTAAGFNAGESLTLDFDSVINLEGGSSRTFLVSAVNNALSFQVGANAGQQVSVQFGDMRATALGFAGETQTNGNSMTVDGINVTTLTGANEALAIIDEALNQVESQRSALGAFTNRLEATISNLGVASENLTSSESLIRDADIAEETTTFTRNNILLQAGTSILAQANSAPQQVLSLLNSL